MKLLNRMLRAVTESKVGDGENVGRYEVVVRDTEPDGGPTPWGKRVVESYESNPPATNGVGTDLIGPAFDEVKSQVNPFDVEPGTVVATVVVDLDVWDYRIEWEER